MILLSNEYFIGQLITVTVPLLLALLTLGKVVYNDAKFRAETTENMKSIAELLNCLQTKVERHDSRLVQVEIKTGVLEERSKKQDRYAT